MNHPILLGNVEDLDEQPDDGDNPLICEFDAELAHQREMDAANARIAEIEAENKRLKEERVGDNHWIIDLQQIRGRLEAQLAEAYAVIDTNRWPDTAAKLLREAESRAEEYNQSLIALSAQWHESEMARVAAEAQLAEANERADYCANRMNRGEVERHASKQRAEQAEARAQEAVSILADMHDREDERCRFHGAQGHDVGCLACMAQDALQPAPDTKQLNTVGDALALVNEATQEEIRQCAPGESLNEYRKRMALQSAPDAKTNDPS